ncbi:MAG TPA: LacI family transcriptional regulator [Epulopiscium sp.]|nr:LacI family transcriptional regulator [Candidatus Epulonipiscium sp.]
MSTKPTIKDIALRAGVSHTTVSRVLNDSPSVSPATREKILSVINELDYSPDVNAQMLRTKRSKTIGIIFPDYLNPFYYKLFHHLELEARLNGYQIIISSTGDNKEDYIKTLVQRNVDGLIVCNYQYGESVAKYLYEISKTKPVVFMDHFQYADSVNLVYSDGYRGIQTTTRHIIDNGHTNIGYVGSLGQYKVAKDRLNAYKNTLEDFNIPFVADWLFEGDYTTQAGEEAAKYFLSCSSKPSAIVFANDAMAIGALKHFIANGISVPEDIAIIGFDDIDLCELLTPALSSYRQPIEQISKVAMDLFLEYIEDPLMPKKQIVLDGELVVRSSSN